MKFDNVNITETLNSARLLLETEENISPAMRVMFQLLITIISLFAGRLSLNSKNSHKPPSADPNRDKLPKKDQGSKKKPGGQLGRNGVNLQPVTDPDKIIPINIDKRRLPHGNYHDVGFEKRQVVDIEISRIITEYRAQILEDANGKKFVAEFPEGVSRPIQYGQSVKSHAVYLSQFQLIPYERVADYFVNEVKIPVSVGSLFNFNKEAYDLLEDFDALSKTKLISSKLIHADETSINLNGTKIWLHNASNELWTYFYPHEHRGSAAMNEIAILPKFKGILVHDHWKPYYTYAKCRHALCNAHHIRELQWVIDNTDYKWAKKLQDLLVEINKSMKDDDTPVLKRKTAEAYRLRYRQILCDGNGEMPMPEATVNADGKKKRGRVKKAKERNLLERLRDYESDVLRFMTIDYVPFTNNRGENDIRMTKVQQKISGCFKSIDGAKIFCRVRSYLLTAQKHGITPTDALKSLFAGKLPDIFYTE